MESHLVCELAGKYSLLSQCDYCEAIHGKIVGQLASEYKARELFQRLAGLNKPKVKTGVKRPRLDIAALNELAESFSQG